MRRLTVLIAMVLLAGCGNDPGPEVATARSAPPGGTPSGSAVATPAAETDYDKALRYTRCMNEQGVALPDPVVGKPLAIGVPPAAGSGGQWIQVGGKEFEACRHFMPATWPVKMDPADIVRERPFGECLRKHGFDWPEPDADGMMHYAADPTTLNTPEYRAAEDACRYLYDDPANGAQDR